MSVAMIHDLYAHHHWANRRLLDAATKLGSAAERPVGTQFTAPTLVGMFAHIGDVDALWLARWKGVPPAPSAMAGVTTLAALGPHWDAVEDEQRRFLEALTSDALERVVDYTFQGGRPGRLPLAVLLHHVTDHGTHHRSEIATMITMLGAAPPPCGVAMYRLLRSGQEREAASAHGAL